MNKQTEELDSCFDLWVETDLSKEIDNKDKLKKIFEYVNWLKKEHRDVFMYRIWEDLSYKEIAEITGITESNCKQIVSRTLKNIWANFALLTLLLII
jgi:RNA polymerase sigma factor (sigma-70 family)